MDPKHPASVLIVCDKERFTEGLCGLLNQEKDCSIKTLSTELEGRNCARDNLFDIIIINSPLENSLGDEFARTLTRITYAAVLILVPEQIAEKIEKKVEGTGVFVIRKPLKKAEFLEDYRVAVLTSERSRVLYDENVKLKRKIRELKTIERAKVLLVEYLKLSEDQAHKYIEQQAMELRTTTGEIAQNIISTYEIG